MLVDTHCHVNMMVKKTFDAPLSPDHITAAQQIVDEAIQHQVTTIINVGTSLVESQNCVILARRFKNIYAAIGLHPNDCTPAWREDLAQLTKLLATDKQHIVAIGECGLDKHYPDYDLPRQIDAFKAQIELAITHKLALIVHTRKAYDETLKVLEEYQRDVTRGIIHCFSEDQAFADTATSFGYVLGIGGPLTYPRNDVLRSVFKTVPLEKIVLETDAPFLPPQELRGKQNHPKQISTVARYLAGLRGITLDEVVRTTTQNSMRVFGL